jgi:hypothetical protein
MSSKPRIVRAGRSGVKAYWNITRSPLVAMPSMRSSWFDGERVADLEVVRAGEDSADHDAVPARVAGAFDDVRGADGRVLGFHAHEVRDRVRLSGVQSHKPGDVRPNGFHPGVDAISLRCSSGTIEGVEEVSRAGLDHPEIGSDLAEIVGDPRLVRDEQAPDQRDQHHREGHSADRDPEPHPLPQQVPDPEREQRESSGRGSPVRSGARERRCTSLRRRAGRHGLGREVDAPQ